MPTSFFIQSSVCERGVEDALQRRRDRPHLVELLDVAGEHLDVARLVHGLRRGVELGVGVRHRVHELRRHHERALLAVQEVAQAERRRAARELPARLLGERLASTSLLDRHAPRRAAWSRTSRGRSAGPSRGRARRSTAPRPPSRRGGAARRPRGRSSTGRRPSWRSRGRAPASAVVSVKSLIGMLLSWYACVAGGGPASASGSLASRRMRCDRVDGVVGAPGLERGEAGVDERHDAAGIAPQARGAPRRSGGEAQEVARAAREHLPDAIAGHVGEQHDQLAPGRVARPRDSRRSSAIRSRSRRSVARCSGRRRAIASARHLEQQRPHHLAQLRQQRSRRRRPPWKIIGPRTLERRLDQRPHGDAVALPDAAPGRGPRAP